MLKQCQGQETARARKGKDFNQRNPSIWKGSLVIKIRCPHQKESKKALLQPQLLIITMIICVFRYRLNKGQVRFRKSQVSLTILKYFRRQIVLNTSYHLIQQSIQMPILRPTQTVHKVQRTFPYVMVKTSQTTIEQKQDILCFQVILTFQCLIYARHHKTQKNFP